MGKRFIMNAGRTSKQGQQINVGKDYAEYQAIVNTLTMHPDDMKALGIAAGRERPGPVRVRGEATFQCTGGQGAPRDDLRPLRPADLPAHGAETDGTGMPTSKGWEVEVEPIGATGRCQRSSRFGRGRAVMDAAG